MYLLGYGLVMGHDRIYFSIVQMYLREFSEVIRVFGTYGFCRFILLCILLCIFKELWKLIIFDKNLCACYYNYIRLIRITTKARREPMHYCCGDYVIIPSCDDKFIVVARSRWHDYLEADILLSADSLRKAVKWVDRAVRIDLGITRRGFVNGYEVCRL